MLWDHPFVLAKIGAVSVNETFFMHTWVGTFANQSRNYSVQSTKISV